MTWPITASLNEFLGYDDRGLFDDQGTNRHIEPTPHFRLQQLPVTTTVWDGQTLIIGGGRRPAEKPDVKPDRNKKCLLVMVTPTVIDPAGNRVHTDQEVESARSQAGIWHPTMPPRSAN